MIAIFKAWIASKLRIIEWSALGLILALSAYGGYHTRVILDEAAQSRHSEKLAQVAPKIVTETQVITRLVRASNDPCTSTIVPADVLKRLR